MATHERVVEHFPGIWQIVGANRSAHAYLVRGSRRNILIDSGLPTTYDYLVAALAEIGLRPADIDLVVLTHEHIDHAGGSLRLAEHCPIAAHRLAANKIALADEFTMMSNAFATDIAAFDVDILLEEGCRLNAGGVLLHVLHTPGHCSGSICVYEPQRRILFSADTIMAKGILGGVVGSGNASDYIESLERLSAMRIDCLMPGHGRISRDADSDLREGTRRLRALIDDSHVLFSTLRGTARGFDDIVKSLRDLNAL